MKITLNGKEVDFSRAFPITLGDFRKLQRDYGANLETIERNPDDVEQLVKLLLFLCQKANSEVTEADLDMLPMTEMVKIQSFIAGASKVIDRPSSPPSTN